jgi:preprotein translocase subunit YajC
MDSGIGQFIPLILIFVIFYFFLIRPQQKKVKEHKAMVQIAENINVEVVRATGIQGLINTAEPKK